MAFHVFDNSMTHTIPILYICYLLLLKSKKKACGMIFKSQLNVLPPLIDGGTPHMTTKTATDRN